MLCLRFLLESVAFELSRACEEEFEGDQPLQ